nr:hypothetical protein [Tanacetum cinerariifolium]
MVCKIWDVNATPGRTIQQRSGTRTLDFYLTNSRYPFELVELENLDVTNNKYLIGLEFRARFCIQTCTHSTRGRKVTLMIVGYGQDAAALSLNVKKGEYH